MYFVTLKKDNIDSQPETRTYNIDYRFVMERSGLVDLDSRRTVLNDAQRSIDTQWRTPFHVQVCRLELPRSVDDDVGEHIILRKHLCGKIPNQLLTRVAPAIGPLRSIWPFARRSMLRTLTADDKVR